MKEKLINHGVPQHDFFGIIQPYDKEEHTPIFRGEKPKYSLLDPKTKQKVLAEAWEVWKFSIDDLPGAFVRLIYGFSVQAVRDQLLRKYPELEVNKMVTIILMKRIEN